MEKRMQDNIDLKKIYGTIRKYKLVIGLIIVLSVTLMALYLWCLAKPVYQSKTQVLVNQTEKINNLQEQEVQANLKLIDTYTAIITSPRILAQVSEEMDDRYSISELAKVIQVQNNANSQVLTITAEYGNPNAAAEMADKTVEVFKKEIPKIMKINNVSVLSSATKSNHPIKPNKTLMLVLSFLLGVILAFLFVLYQTLFDRTIKNEEDIRNELELVVLGTIGNFKRQEMQTVMKKGKRR